ncbi:hypothetical protein DYB38_006944 [Aphanomyces astaci]|uniref:Uncharacterized protein n=1 Tax=Aphanomyces astaci TaxID=112090 RepID=A0A397DRQ6_APHAT|nr:hypothetical protein DYB38_006944 [Aphanomyces astaci]
MQDQVSQLQLQCHQLALTIPTTTSNNPRDSTTQGTIQRLEGALEHAKEALATARHDMKAQHDKYTELLVAHERIKNGRIAANNLHTNIVYNDASTQTTAEDLPPPPLTHSMACQAELIIAALEQSPKVADIVQCTTSQKPVLVDASTQSDPATELPPPDDDVVEVTEVVQTTGDVVMTKEAPSPNPVPICIENPMDNSTQPATSHTGVAGPVAATTVATPIAHDQRAMDDESATAILPPELTAAYIQDIMDMIELRADKYTKFLYFSP